MFDNIIINVFVHYWSLRKQIKLKIVHKDI
jgi:hypothetical protein